jgi:ABC-2 type transport system permease protein
MSVMTYTAVVSPTARTTTARRSLKAEWTKLYTLPSTWRTAAIAAAAAIGMSAAVAASQASQWHTLTAQQRLSFDPTSASMSGVMIAALLLGALAVRTVTAGYSTGMIRSTFTAMPTRRLVLVAKAATAAAFVFPVALLCDAVGFQLGQRILAGKHLQVGIGHPGVIQAIVLGAVAVSLIGIVGVGLGGVIRHTAGSTTALSLVVVGGLLFDQFVPAGLRQYLPATAMQAAVTVHRSAGLLRSAAAIAVLCGYAAIALGAATIRVAHRDA